MASIKRAISLLTVIIALAACGPTGATTEQQTSGIKSATYNAPLNNLTASTVNIDAPFEKAFVSASTESTNLIDAEVEYIGDMTFSSDNGVVMLAESGTLNLSSPDKPLRWNVLLHPSPTLSLNLDTASGEMTLDASGLNLAALDLQSASGTIDADLPALADTVTVSVDTASGQITVNLADNAAANFTSVEVASGAFNLNVGAGANVTLENLSIASGNIKVDVAPQTAVRLEVQSVASGTINIAYPMVRITGTASDEGIWETDGFAAAENQVSIVVTSIASGTFELE